MKNNKSVSFFEKFLIRLKGPSEAADFSDRQLETEGGKLEGVDSNDVPKKPSNAFVMGFIDSEERRWNTPEKQEKTITAEKREIEKFLATDGK